jgi:hypothetical protein
MLARTQAFIIYHTLLTYTTLYRSRGTGSNLKKIDKKVKIDENVLQLFGTTLTPKIKWAIKIFHR